MSFASGGAEHGPHYSGIAKLVVETQLGWKRLDSCYSTIKAHAVLQQVQWEQMGSSELAKAGNRRRSIKMNGSTFNAPREKAQTSVAIAGIGKRKLTAMSVISLVLTEHYCGHRPSLGRRSLLPETPMVEAMHRHM